MWKITNELNKFKLNKFREAVIENSFFEILLHLSQFKKEKLKSIIECNENNPKKNKKNIEIFQYIFKRKSNGRKLGNLFKKILSKYTEQKISYYYYIYKKQNKKVDNYNYNISQVDIPEDFKYIFNNFFYKKFFDNDYIWNLIDNSSFSRKQFHRNFKKENNLEVCPYCDIDTTLNPSNNYVEHFLPKSNYPFLAMNPINLISSCGACNKSAEGKGSKHFIPMLTPYNKQIGDLINFSINFNNESIFIERKNKEKGLTNYIKLFQLKDRYGSKRVFDQVEKRARTIYDTFYKLNDLQYSDIMGYIKEYDKTIPLNFVLKDIMKDYIKYDKDSKKSSPTSSKPANRSQEKIKNI